MFTQSAEAHRFPHRIIRPFYERTSWHRSVIEEVDHPRTRMAYAYCREVTRHYARTFYLACRFLPRHKQRSIFAVYALCRRLDNIIDHAEDPHSDTAKSNAELKADMESWRESLINTYNGSVADDPILVAFADVLRHHDIPLEYPLKLIEGVSTDIEKKRYETFEDVYDYAYKVASVVGLMTAGIFGYEHPDTPKYAEKLGIAMQLTNILRDVGEDLQNGRIYLPRQELETYGVTEAHLQEGRIDEAFKAFMKFQISRARNYYLEATPGIAMLSRECRFPVMLAHYNYRRILDRIEANDYDVFSGRAHLTFTDKITALPKLWMLIDSTPATLQRQL